MVNWKEELPKIIAMGEQGKSMADVARHYEVSRQRIKQIVKQFIPEWKEELGRAVVAKAKADRFHSKWGMKEDTDLYHAQRCKFRAKKANAYRAGQAWNLTFGSLGWPTHCPILGIELDYFSEGRQENSVSFDKHNPSLGYTDGNVFIVSWRANRIKNDGTAEEFKLILDYMLNKVC